MDLSEPHDLFLFTLAIVGAIRIWADAYQPRLVASGAEPSPPFWKIVDWFFTRRFVKQALGSPVPEASRLPMPGTPPQPNGPPPPDYFIDFTAKPYTCPVCTGAIFAVLIASAGGLLGILFAPVLIALAGAGVGALADDWKTYCRLGS